MKKTIVASLLLAFLMIMGSVSVAGSSDQSLLCMTPRGVVDKAPGDVFFVGITFGNIGKTVGKWSVNVDFEGAKWTWTGVAQNLTLEPSGTEVLKWNGSVPSSAPINSTARLIVYYGDSFVALNWWIHVVPAAQLSIVASTVQ